MKTKARKLFFTMRLNKQEMAYIELIADELQRTKADAIRFIIRERAKEIISPPQPHEEK